MVIDPEVAPEPASAAPLLTIDAEDRLRPVEDNSLDVSIDQLFAVVVVWNDDRASWRGWLSTNARRSVRFCAADLEGPILRSWLSRLPDWNHDKLGHATTTPGIHLVWRRLTTGET